MTNVLRFHAPGPWLTRDLKECVLASDYDGMEAAWRNACERGDKAVARLAEVERFIEELRDESAEDWRTTKYVVVQMTEETWDKLKAWGTPDSASVPCADCGEPTDQWYDGTHLCWKCRA